MSARKKKLFLFLLATITGFIDKMYKNKDGVMGRDE
jgi:hypothetical protein